MVWQSYVYTANTLTLCRYCCTDPAFLHTTLKQSQMQSIGIQTQLLDCTHQCRSRLKFPIMNWVDDSIAGGQHMAFTWWRHQMETFSALLAFCAGNSPHKDQWRGLLMFTLICARINGWVNNREAGDLRCHRANYDIIVMIMNDCAWVVFGHLCFYWSYAAISVFFHVVPTISITACMNWLE